jgi:hypothetical protein
MNVIAPVDNTNNIRFADFVRVIAPDGTYRFSTAPMEITVPAVDALPFNALGQLVRVNDVTRDIKSTANETTFSLVGIDTANLGFVLGQQIKGSQIQAWKGFFNTNGELITSGGAGGLYQYFNGYVSSYVIAEQWMEEIRSYVGVITIAASSIQLVLQNRIAGRYTNDSSWQFFNAGDTSMNRVSVIQNANFYFGKGAAPNS